MEKKSHFFLTANEVSPVQTQFDNQQFFSDSINLTTNLSLNFFKHSNLFGRFPFLLCSFSLNHSPAAVAEATVVETTTVSAAVAALVR
jgi:hypothetical protein